MPQVRAGLSDKGRGFTVMKMVDSKQPVVLQILSSLPRVLVHTEISPKGALQVGTNGSCQ